MVSIACLCVADVGGWRPEKSEPLRRVREMFLSFSPPSLLPSPLHFPFPVLSPHPSSSPLSPFRFSHFSSPLHLSFPLFLPSLPCPSSSSLLLTFITRPLPILSISLHLAFFPFLLLRTCILLKSCSHQLGDSVCRKLQFGGGRWGRGGRERDPFEHTVKQMTRVCACSSHGSSTTFQNVGRAQKKGTNRNSVHNLEPNSSVDLCVCHGLRPPRWKRENARVDADAPTE